jgi:hypothetical protein
MQVDSLSFPLSNQVNIRSNKLFYENYVKKLWANYQRPNWKYYVGDFFKNISKKK